MIDALVAFMMGVNAFKVRRVRTELAELGVRARGKALARHFLRVGELDGLVQRAREKPGMSLEELMEHDCDVHGIEPMVAGMPFRHTNALHVVSPFWEGLRDTLMSLPVVCIIIGYGLFKQIPKSGASRTWQFLGLDHITAWRAAIGAAVVLSGAGVLCFGYAYLARAVGRGKAKAALLIPLFAAIAFCWVKMRQQG